MRYLLSLLVVAAMALPACAYPGMKSNGRWSGSTSTGRSNTTVIVNPYGVRAKDGYHYAWVRHNGQTTIVVTPNVGGTVITPPAEPDHWDRARIDYFNMMYGPGGVYAPR